jgi:hypothetical protein
LSIELEYENFTVRDFRRLLEENCKQIYGGRRRKVYVARFEYRSMKGQTKKFQKTVEFQG